MSLTASQRQARRRRKLKDGNVYEEYKKKNALWQRLKSAGKRKKEAELPPDEQRNIKAEGSTKKTSSDRVAKHRASEKSNVQAPTSLFKSIQALGRTVSKAKRALIQQCQQHQCGSKLCGRTYIGGLVNH